MQALVHFTVGIIVALAALTVVDRSPREEFVLVFVSGFWGMVPDGHWLFHEFGFDGIAQAWRAFHQSVYADLFWLHGLIDSLETGRENLEAGLGLVVLVVAVGVYYRFNDWTID